MGNVKDFVGLEVKKLNIHDIIEIVLSAKCGAVSTFIGTTRDHFHQKKVRKLEYEAYEPMAIKKMQAVCNKVRSQWDVEKIAIYHRLGEVSVMEPSIVIAISSIHRQESLQAVQFAIDTIKSSVPIWKKEIYENDEQQWKENEECFWRTNCTKFSMDKTDNIIKESSMNNTNLNSVIVDDIEIDIDNVYETVEIKSENIYENYEQFEENSCEDFKIDADQIQIKADAQELNRRIESFIYRKREQVNLINIQGFCIYSAHIQEDNNDSTCVCARVNAIFIKRKDCKSHVKVHRVHNQWSQQNIKPSVPFSLKKETNNYAPALDERISTAEKILGINKPVPRDVYERIKNIEDRLLLLESISPEYKDLWAIDDCDSVKSFDAVLNDKFNSNNSVT